MTVLLGVALLVARPGSPPRERSGPSPRPEAPARHDPTAFEWVLPRHEAERDAFGRRAPPGDPWEVHTTHLERRGELMVTTWRMALRPDETPRPGAGSVTPEVFAFFTTPRSGPARPIDRVWIVLRAWRPIWPEGAVPVLRTSARSIALRIPWAGVWFGWPAEDEGAYDESREQELVGWLPADESAEVALEGIAVIEVEGLRHDVPQNVRRTLARFADRIRESATSD